LKISKLETKIEIKNNRRLLIAHCRVLPASNLEKNFGEISDKKTLILAKIIR